jgi:hypothetical protein
MQIENDNQKVRYDNPTWRLIADCSLGEATSDGKGAAELNIRLLFQAMRELGVPPECLNRIEGTITEITRVRGEIESPHLTGSPVNIYLFCDKRTTDNVHHSEERMKGGWGYYVIERGSDFPGTSCQEHHRVIELYLYKEGIISSTTS